MDNPTTPAKAAAAKGGKKMTCLGVILMILGILALLAPGFSGASIALVLGVIACIAGVVRMIWAFKSGTLGGGILVFAIGGLTLLCGLALVTDPVVASGMLTVLVAIYFIVDGLSELAGGFRMRPDDGWGWLIFSGILSVILGFMVFAQFPLSGFWAIGTLLGIKFFLAGLVMVTTGGTVDEMARE